MSTVRVWAPRAERVELVTDHQAKPLSREPNGWWGGERPAEGSDYGFRLDGGPVRPDPRSRLQPRGVHERSRMIEVSPPADMFVATPLDRAVIYELHVGTFTEQGTFGAAIDRLGHLAQLGITHVELMPIAQFPGTFGWGYDGVELYATHAAYGGPLELRRFVVACHARGLAVLLDVVHNHLGPEGNYLDEFGPFHTAKHHTPWGDGINFDADGAHEVRRYFIESAVSWLRDFGIDGLRLDAVHAIVDTSRRHFVAELSDAVRALATELGRELVVIAEYDEHDPSVVTPTSSGGYGVHAHWNDDFHHALHAYLTGESQAYYQDFASPDALAAVLANGYYLDGRVSHFRGGPHGKPFGSLPRDRLVAYTQSHDQIGNRAGGERLAHLAGTDRARIAAAVLLTSPFVPMLFQGEEWAASTPFVFFADYGDPALRDAVRQGRRREHGSHDLADPMSPATRARCVLKWDEALRATHAATLEWYRSLIALRREHPELRDPDPRATSAEQRGELLTVVRGALSLLVNASDRSVSAGLGDVILSSRPLQRSNELPPRSCVVVRARS
jgi:maltooligosyltrehalose trehalohydrolase